MVMIQKIQPSDYGEPTPLSSPEHPFPKRRSAKEEGEYSPAGYDADLNAPTITPEELAKEKEKLAKLALERAELAKDNTE